MPESNNVGWEATGPDGTALRRVVVNGWQQGWILPAGSGGTVTLDFPADRWYRLGIFGGLALLVLLGALALARPCAVGESMDSQTAHGWRSRILTLALSVIVAGVAGPVVVAVVGGGAWYVARRKGTDVAARLLVVVAGVGGALSAAALSQGPWRSIDGYVGHAWWVQLPALIAIVAVGLADLPPRSSA